MANEYQITHNSIEVLRDGSATGAVQISQSAVEVLRDGLGVAPIQLSAMAIEVLRDGVPIGGDGIQVSLIAIEVLRSLTMGFRPTTVPSRRAAHPIALVDVLLPTHYAGRRLAYPVASLDAEPPAEFIVSPLFFQRRGVFPISVQQTGITSKLPEQNPYRPTLPEEIWDISETLGRFLREQSEILRQQHNNVQAGDSTFPWELLTRYALEREYTLGSTGRFFHPTLGLIIARYVQFGRDWVATPIPTTPVGYYSNADAQEWYVTNDLSRSSSELALGLVFIQEVPPRDSFGWVVTQGANPLPIQAQGIPSRPNQPYTWALDGVLQAGGLGTIFGSRRPVRNDPIIGTGEFYVDVGYLSDASIVALSSAALTELTNQLVAQGISIGIIQGDVISLETSVTTINLTLTVLDTRIQAEETNRISEIARVEALIGIGTVSDAELAAALAIVNAAWAAADGLLSIRIDTAQSRADSAYALAASIDAAGFQLQIDATISGLASTNVRVQALEDFGAYPPQLGFMGW